MRVVSQAVLGSLLALSATLLPISPRTAGAIAPRSHADAPMATATEPPAPPASPAAQNLLNRAESNLTASQWEAARTAAQSALDAATQASDEVGKARAYTLRARAEELLNQNDMACADWQAAIALWEKLDDEAGMAEAWSGSGVARLASDLPEADSRLRRALELVRNAKRRPLAATDKLDRSYWETSRRWLKLHNALATGKPTPALQADVQRLATLAWDIASAIREVREHLAPDSESHGGALFMQGQLGKLQGRAEAEICYRDALAILQKAKPDSGLIYLCEVAVGDYEEEQCNHTGAIQLYRDALVRCKKLEPNSRNHVLALGHLGLLLTNSDPVEAICHFSKALAIIDASSSASPDLEAVLLNASAAYINCGDFGTAIARLTRLLEKLEARNADVPEIADTLLNLGEAYRTRGDHEAAKVYFTLIIEICQGRFAEYSAVRLARLNAALLADGQDKKAIVKKAVSLIEEQIAGGEPDFVRRGGLFHDLGVNEALCEKYADAENNIRKALDLWERDDPGPMTRGLGLTSLADVLVKQAKWQEGKQTADRACELLRQVVPDSPGMAQALNNRGEARMGLGDLEGAEKDFQAARTLIERATATIGDDEGRRALAGDHGYLITNLVNCRLKRDKLESAFQALEEGRAESLRLLLSERRQQVGSPPEYAAYVQAVRNRTSAFAVLAGSERTLEQARGLQAGAGNTVLRAAVARAEQKRKEADAAYTQSRARADSAWQVLTRANPRLYAPALPLQEARKALPSGALYAAYAVGEKESLLFLLGAKGPVRVLHLQITRAALNQRIKDFHKALAWERATQADAAQAGRRLYNTLFPVEARSLLRSASRLVVSPDGPLWGASFAAFVTNPAGAPAYLGLDKPLVYASSLTLYAAARTSPPSGNAPNSSLVPNAPPCALLVGNPLFAPKVARTVPIASTKKKLASASALAARLAQRGERGTLWSDDVPLQPLPVTETEVRGIAPDYHASPLLGSGATECAVRKRIAAADVVHLATHGFYAPQIAMASGIVLTPPAANKPPSTDDDGALQAWEVAGFGLRADLVVLSACETGRGNVQANEGMVGLTRAFQFAGARSVVASQWKVKDDKSAILMIAFHHALRQGIAKDEALRLAMRRVALQSGGKTLPPYYWAAFFLQGSPDNHLFAPPRSARR